MFGVMAKPLCSVKFEDLKNTVDCPKDTLLQSAQTLQLGSRSSLHIALHTRGTSRQCIPALGRQLSLEIAGGIRD